MFELSYPGRPDIISINDLQRKADYRVITWYGLADGANLNLGFNIGDFQNRYVVLKSFKIIPYTQIATQDFYVNDGVVTNSELIPMLTRINRLFDTYENSTAIEMILNGAPVKIFSNVAPLTRYPLDLDIDNVFCLLNAKIQTWNLAITGVICDDLENNTTNNPYLKVVVECYIL